MADEPKNYVAQRGSLVPGGHLSLSAKQTTGAGTAFVLPAAYSVFGVEYFRGTTSTSNESTSASIQLQGRLGSTRWHSLGAAITVNNKSTAPAIARSTNAIPVNEVRFRIVSFTTSAGNSTAGGENKIPITAYISVGLGSS